MSKKSVMRQMQQSTEPFHVIGSRQADDLVAAKLVRKVNVQPAPGQGRTAVSLTAIGKAWKGDPIEPIDPPTADEAAGTAED